MRKIIISGLFAIAVAGLAYASDRDRHADYTDPKAPATATACKGFYNLDDNLSPCNDFCGQWRTEHEGASCECSDGKCPADDHP